MKIDLILNAESLQSPLTGIGLYTRHLAQELVRLDDISEFRCFYRGSVIDAPQCLQSVDDVRHDTTQRRDRRLSWLQALADRTTLPYRAHMLRARLLFRRYTKQLGDDYVYHEPNYILKPFHGPKVITVHDLTILHHPQFHPRSRVEHFTRYLGQSLQYATQVVTDSEFVRQQVLERFALPPDKVTAIHLGVSSIFAPRAREETKPVLQQYGLRHGNYLLCVATHEPRKNLMRLVDAYAALPAHLRENYPLVLVGSRGWHSSGLAARIQARDVADSVLSPGYAPREHLPALFAGARVFAFPSIEEGFGLPVLEAMASGTPVVTSRDSAMSEVTRDSALLVDPLSTDSIRDGLVRLLSNEELASQLAASALVRAGGFTWQRCARAHLEVYRRAIRDG